jgi:hypothetical protein
LLQNERLLACVLLLLAFCFAKNAPTWSDMTDHLAPFLGPSPHSEVDLRQRLYGHCRETFSELARTF